jgi:cytochrome P450
MTHNFFLDLLSSDLQRRYYETLREEAETALTPQTMPQLESAIRESLRLSPLSDRMLSRRVVQKGGIRLPDGQVLRHGTWIAVATTGIHRDERNYESPNEYRPFRFCSAEGKMEKSKGSTPIPLTSEEFLAFGHGRHSWLVLACLVGMIELKMQEYANDLSLVVLAVGLLLMQ